MPTTSKKTLESAICCVGILLSLAVFGTLSKGYAYAQDTRAVDVPKDANSGRIVFVSDRDGNKEIYVMNPDGSGQSRLTKNLTLDYQPRLSADGRQIVFVSDRERIPEIYVMNADGTEQTRLTYSENGNYSPAFSPDGGKIVFTTSREGVQGIYVMDADGKNQVRLTNTPETHKTSPVFSPDGRQIAYVAWGKGGGGGTLIIMNSDGSDPKPLTNGITSDSAPAFSPDGRAIAFASTREGVVSVFEMKVDSGEVRHVGVLGDTHPSFSPNGRRIVVQGGAAPFGQAPGGIYVMNRDGSDRQSLTAIGEWGSVSDPFWGRGERIVEPITVPFPTPTPLPALALKEPETPVHDPLQSFSAMPLPGKLVYAWNNPNDPPGLVQPSAAYLAFHQKGNEQSVNEAQPRLESSSVLYRIEGLSGRLKYKPQFSPDGKHVLVQSVVSGTGYQRYTSYIWEVGTRQLKPLSPTLLNGWFVSWSPDSSYLLYHILGDTPGKPSHLVLFNRRTGKEQVVTEWGDLNTSFTAWMAPRTLLYTKLPDVELSAPQLPRLPARNEETEKGQAAIVRPNIYEYSAESGQSRLFIRDGQHPFVSPDSQWIAFFGSQDPTRPLPLNPDWPTEPGYAPLSAIRRDGTQRTPISSKPGAPYPPVLWRPRLPRMLTVSAGNDEAGAFYELREYNPTSGGTRLLRTLMVGSLKRTGDVDSFASLYFWRLSEDGRFLLIPAEQYEKQTADRSKTHVLLAYDLDAGRVATVARVKNELGFDWYGGSAAVTATAPKAL